MSRFRVFICAPLTDFGQLSPKAMESHRFVAVHANKDLGRAGFAPLCEPIIYDEMRKLDESYQARAFEEAKVWIQTVDIFLRLRGECREADQREWFARQKEIPIVTSVKQVIERLSRP